MNTSCMWREKIVDEIKERQEMETDSVEVALSSSNEEWTKWVSKTSTSLEAAIACLSFFLSLVPASSASQSSLSLHSTFPDLVVDPRPRPCISQPSLLPCGSQLIHKSPQARYQTIVRVLDSIMLSFRLSMLQSGAQDVHTQSICATLASALKLANEMNI